MNSINQLSSLRHLTLDLGYLNVCESQQNSFQQDQHNPAYMRLRAQPRRLEFIPLELSILRQLHRFQFSSGHSVAILLNSLRRYAPENANLQVECHVAVKDSHDEQAFEHFLQLPPEVSGKIALLKLTEILRTNWDFDIARIANTFNFLTALKFDLELSIESVSR